MFAYVPRGVLQGAAFLQDSRMLMTFSQRSSCKVKTPGIKHLYNVCILFLYLACSEEGDEVNGLEQAPELPRAVEPGAVLRQGVDEEAQLLARRRWRI